MTAVDGILLGKDLLKEVVPGLGPEVVAYLDTPTTAEDGTLRLPLVMALAVDGDPGDRMGLPAALKNALRTVMAVARLEKSPDALRVETIEPAGARVTALVGGSTTLAYAIGPGFLAFGTDPESVAAFASGSSRRGSEPSTFQQVRSTYFPDAESFAYADLDAVSKLARAHREALVRRIAADQGADEGAIRRDLNAVLALIGLFRAGYLTQVIAPDFTSVRQTVGLLANPPADPLAGGQR